MTTITFTQFLLLSSLIGLVEISILSFIIELCRRFVVKQRRKRKAKKKYS
jgi:hypothetical protein